MLTISVTNFCIFVHISIWMLNAIHRPRPVVLFTNAKNIVFQRHDVTLASSYAVTRKYPYNGGNRVR